MYTNYANRVINQNNIIKNEHAAIKSLKEDQNIIIAKADKGNTTVVLDKSNYLSKLEDNFNNVITYEQIIFDPCNKLRK